MTQVHSLNLDIFPELQTDFFSTTFPKSHLDI